MDADSKEMILRLLESDEAATTRPTNNVMSTHKSNEAMKSTSRRQLWSNEDKALFATGVVCP